MSQQLSLRTHQLKAVDALIAFDELCKREGIQYFLEAGSCLGSIRHHGFIPWDDDIDIDMNIENFNRFREVIQRETSFKYTWKHTDVDDNYPTLSGKIMDGGEPLITVFPLVKLSDNKILAKTQWWIRKVFSPIYQRKCKYTLEKINSKQLVSIIFSSILSIFFSKKRVLDILRWNEIRYDHLSTKYSINLYSKYSMKRETLNNEWLEEFVEADFEGRKYPIIKNYHDYLTHLYGDYMTPPPVEKRVAEHL